MKYEIKELNAGEMLEIIDLASSNPKQFQMEIVKRSVNLNGVPLGEAALKMPFSEYMTLANEVMEKHQFGGDGKKS